MHKDTLEGKDFAVNSHMIKKTLEYHKKAKTKKQYHKKKLLCIFIDTNDKYKKR